jgi:hypothetical protein
MSPFRIQHGAHAQMEKVQLEDSVKAQSIRIVDANGGMTGVRGSHWPGLSADSTAT